MKLVRRGQRWAVDYSADGVRRRELLPASIVTELAAQAWLSEFRASRDALTLRRFISDYLTERRPHLSEQTLRSYRLSLNSLESYFGLSRRIDSLTARDIGRWAAERLASGIKPVSVNIDLRNVQAALNRALSWGLIDKAPKIEKLKTPKRLPSHLTPQQFQAILDHEADARFRDVWSFLVWTGLRRGELVNLRWEDIQLAPWPQARITGKGDRQRVVPLLPPAVAVLGEARPSGLVFEVGGKDYLTHRFLRAARAAGVQAHLHHLRHTALTWMVGQGVPIKLVQEVAGHTDIKTTLHYAKAFTGGTYKTLAQAFGFAPG